MTSQWDGILRCKTWNVWPARTTGELPSLDIDYGGASPVHARAFVHAYDPKLQPELNLVEPSDIGPPLWDGEQPGWHQVRDALLVGVGDQVQLAQAQPRTARRGELDIRLSFEFDGNPQEPLVEALRAYAFEILALLNLCLDDLVTPTMPFHVRENLPDDQAEATLSFKVEVRHRHTLDDGVLSDFLMSTAQFLSDPSHGPKYRIALELYAAHFTEKQVRVRFILLVIAMEALAQPSNKEPAAQSLVSRWGQELKEEMAKHDPSTAAYRDLISLSGQLKWLGQDSIGVQIANLFSDLPDVSVDEIDKLKKSARDIYNKRSRLVHDGYLPAAELPDLENEARTLVEILFKSAIEKSKFADERFTIRIEDHAGPESDPDNA
ncbi:MULTISPECIES: hypothetical protein [unclassified Mycolicibacterium]|uniref:hypothetical protein n=1 Tax=unclassified Mycolicibacterium TaxID=2636767 RepID=UPI0012DD6B48|nr:MULTISPECIES: hypothetical protein [unclassified Mycolicibacterium]MUL81264.1 hypothetical protein [Mycolicibacterium sp. CBMA 329]MUL87030.1 hypothetical protein [Mycolicibacterium sp. CBMA 331]MUL98687.1 hypothetical protein [Mycolicibacterium sp. CBMA 334]MUM25550.1 hypothetical protein [Mycolicibacterium sp. CBMA 295]MUM37327.1 hypothetical protein [Mycolicibacterium sp. CBMA 247]